MLRVPCFADLFFKRRNIFGITYVLRYFIIAEFIIVEREFSFVEMLNR